MAGNRRRFLKSALGAGAALALAPRSISWAAEGGGKKILVLRFQASYCKPCVKESPALARIADRYGPRGVEVVAFHVQDTIADTRTFIRKYRVTYPVAVDPKLNIGNSFGFKGSPYTIVIDRKGEMVEQIHGESVVGRLPRILDNLLKKDSRSS